MLEEQETNRMTEFFLLQLRSSLTPECMTGPSRPPPPLRSYTETVQADVDDATSSSFLSLSPTSSVTTRSTAHETTPRRKRAPTLGRRRSNDEIRIPPLMNQPLNHHEQDTTNTTENTSTSPNSRLVGGIGRVRRANSTDLMVLANDQESQSSDSDEGFSSEVSPVPLCLKHQE